jgi:hypothetical protein
MDSKHQPTAPSSKCRSKLAMALQIDQNLEKQQECQEDDEELSVEEIENLRLFQNMFGQLPAVRLGIITTEATPRSTNISINTNEMKEEPKKKAENKEEGLIPNTKVPDLKSKILLKKKKTNSVTTSSFANLTISKVLFIITALITTTETTSAIPTDDISFYVPSPEDGTWRDWLKGFGHDVYRYPEWIMKQKKNCTCKGDSCNVDSSMMVPHAPLSFCASKQFLLQHMPAHDKSYMPPSVSIDGDSMFDDNIAFAMMADASNKWSNQINIQIRMSYVLPYATYQESRQNWRPLFFAKFYQLTEGSASAEDAFEKMVAPNLFLNWTNNNWDSRPTTTRESDYNIQWSSSTSPPIIDPFSFVAYGYSSCTGWATMLTYIARSVGIPARQAGTPCWNSIFEGIDYRGRASDNSNVTMCWHAGLNSGNVNKGGINSYLNNHNWAEIWQNDGSWAWHNVPPTSKVPNSPSLCPEWSKEHGCGWDKVTGCSKVTGGPGAAMEDHEIFSVTWSDVGSDSNVEGGEVVDAATFRWSPLVWAPGHVAPNGDVMFKNGGLRLVNRTNVYRCKE